jgi:UDP-N-acetyl-D-galactosamine dehydrogenase
VNLDNCRICIIGLGYVGLPLSIAFAKKYDVVGFDLNAVRIDELKRDYDRTKEVSAEELHSASNITFTSELNDIADCNCYVVTVPTPVDEENLPDLQYIKSATELVSQIITRGNIIIYESTVYPGLTEEYCVPIIEAQTGLQYNKDFFCGYSPERINPGDHTQKLNQIVKVTSGSNVEVTDFVDSLYDSILDAGTHKVYSIKVAEAAKVIENIQRDVNIALINELTILFDKLGIDTEDVLNAAGTKWNFLPFKPGLVGGHCIPVDPYYLAYKANEIGFEAQLIESGRAVNNEMPTFIVQKLINAVRRSGMVHNELKVLVMGVTFKENCPDVRNSKVVDVVRELEEKKFLVDIYDPWVDRLELESEFGRSTISKPIENEYDVILIAVKHQCFIDMEIGKIRRLGKLKHLIYDIKYAFSKDETDLRL